MANWTNLEIPNINARSHCTSVFARDSIYIFGGYDGFSYLYDIQQYKITQNEWKNVTPEKSEHLARCGHTSLVHNDKILVFGGYSSIHHNDVIEFDLETEKWKEIETQGKLPTKRWCHTAVFDDLHNNMYIFGGFGESTEGKTKVHLNDTFRFDVENKTWYSVNTVGSLPKRNNHTAVIYKDFMFVFAGSKLNDLWRLDLKTNVWQEIKTSALLDSQPGHVYGHTAVVKSNQMYIFGGRFETYKNDLYRYNLKTNKWTKMKTEGQNPLERRNHTAVMNPYTNQMYVFGGYGGSYFNSFYVLKLNVVPTKLGIFQSLQKQEFIDIIINV